MGKLCNSWHECGCPSMSSAGKPCLNCLISVVLAGVQLALSHSMLRKNGNQRFCTKAKIGALFHFHGRWKEHLLSRRASSRWWATSRFARIPLTWIFTEKRGENLQRRNGLTSSLVLLTIILMATATKMVKSVKKRSCSFCAGFCLLWKSDSI